MTMHLSKISRISSLFLVAFLGAAVADDNYILHTDTSSTLSLAVNLYSSLGVKLKKNIGNSTQTVAVVSLPSGFVGSLVAQSLKTISGVVSLEMDLAVALPLPQGSSASPALPPFYGPQYTLFAGRTVWGPYVNQTAGKIIHVGGGWTLSSGSGIVVATIDTGADFTHPALSGYLIPGTDLTRATGFGDESVDLTQETTPILDDQETTPILDSGGTVILNQETTPILDDQETTPILDQETTPILDSRLPAALGHGTMVAGVIHWVAPGALIMPVKAFKSDGSGTLSNVIAGIYWAVDHGANVINLSLSTQTPSDELKHAVAYAAGHNVVCVAAAGNDGKNVTVYPAAYGSVINVGSTDNSDQRSSFSNFGGTLTLAAPGEGVISTYPRNHYASGWGTSFSTPMVSGAAALVAQLRGGDPSLAKKAVSNAAPIGQNLGAGRLDLMQALIYALTH